jgi:O-antigen ligase
MYDASDRSVAIADAVPTAVAPAHQLVTNQEPIGVLLARWTIAIGAVVVTLIAGTFREFELDRFYVPKELVLHTTALLAGALLLRRTGRIRFNVADWLLLAFLLLSSASAAVATNPWLGFRALAVSTSAIALFWCARAACRAGGERVALSGLAVAVVIGCMTALLQAYGVTLDVFSTNRAPGGTLGNRNSVAHLGAFGLPLVMVGALAAKRWFGYFAGAAGTMLVMTALVLTRSRAAWLALAAVLALLLLALLISPVLRRSRLILIRLAGLLLLCSAGAAAAVLIPNSLQWRSENPYLESLRGVAQYQEGSGAGRLIQYRRSMAMAASAPLVGVGPGNWPVSYPAHAARRDPSMSGGTPGTTSNPWPSSDWVAYVSERGYPAAACIAFALILLGVDSLRRLRRSHDASVALAAVAIIGVLAGAVVAGLFDAVLLLAHPALIVFAALGVLTARMGDSSDSAASAAARRHIGKRVLFVALLLVAASGVLRSSAQLYSMHVFTQTPNASALQRAAIVDPGNFRLRVRLARAGSGLSRQERCRHAHAAHRLMPSAHEARNLSRRCGTS